MTLTLIEAVREQAHAELGQDRVMAGASPESYVNGMNNYELLEFIERVADLAQKSKEGT